MKTHQTMKRSEWVVEKHDAMHESCSIAKGNNLTISSRLFHTAKLENELRTEKRKRQARLKGI